MGVVYKLTENISSYIIEQKQISPKISCQDLADKVFASFGQRVSKSSVHELLKQNQVIVPRSRVIKEKFQIPIEKKKQISKDLASFLPVIQSSTPELLDQKIEQRPEPVEKVIPLPAPIEVKTNDDDKIVHKADIFLKCALWDLSFKPILGLKDFNEIDTFNNPKVSPEWDYLTQLIYSIKIELQDNSSFFIDARFQGVYGAVSDIQFQAAAIERAACESADYILNNIEPVIIQNIDLTDLNTTGYDFIASFENLEGKGIRKLSLLNNKAQEFVEFNVPIASKRNFIAGISPKCIEFQQFMNQEKVDEIWQMPVKDAIGKNITLKICKNDNILIITNLISYSYDKITQIYTERYPERSKAHLNYDKYKQTNGLGDSSQAQWLREKLKEQAAIFFPSGFSKEALEEILVLSCIEESSFRLLEVKIKLPKAFKYQEEIKQAVQCINNLCIKDYQGKIVRMLIQES